MNRCVVLLKDGTREDYNVAGNSLRAWNVDGELRITTGKPDQPGYREVHYDSCEWRSYELYDVEGLRGTQAS